MSLSNDFTVPNHPGTRLDPQHKSHAVEMEYFGLLLPSGTGPQLDCLTHAPPRMPQRAELKRQTSRSRPPLRPQGSYEMIVEGGPSCRPPLPTQGPLRPGRRIRQAPVVPLRPQGPLPPALRTPPCGTACRLQFHDLLPPARRPVRATTRVPEYRPGSVPCCLPCPTNQRTHLQPKPD